MPTDQLESPMPSDDTRATRRRKIRALLAGGLVLGVGAAVTLAVWTDNVFGQAQFTAENWNVQGDFSPGGTGVWNEYDTVGTAGTFNYSTGFNALSPGTTVYAPVALRVGTGSTAGGAYAANVTLNGATPVTGPLATALTYTVRQGLTAATCNAAGIAGGTAVVPAGSALGTGSAASAIVLAASGAPTSLCFAVTLPPTVAPNVVSGQTTGVITWQFAAEAVVV